MWCQFSGGFTWQDYSVSSHCQDVESCSWKWETRINESNFFSSPAPPSRPLPTTQYMAGPHQLVHLRAELLIS